MIELDSAPLIALIGLIISIFYNSWSLRESNRTQKDTLMHDMVKQESKYWKDLRKQLDTHGVGKVPKSERSHIFNYYEYLAYLILRKKIDEQQAKDLWKGNILRTYENYKKYFSGDRVEMKKLYDRWKNEDKKRKKETSLKFKDKLIDKILYILTIVVPSMAMIWNAGLIIEWVKGIQSNDISFFLTYAQIALTLFGITMISGFFEKSKDKIKESPKESKHLFLLGILFLSSTISFLYLYSSSFIVIDSPKWLAFFYQILLVATLLIGFMGLVFGLFILLRILIKILKKIE